MKIKKIVFFLSVLSVIISSDIYAQKRKTKPINLGFVFIDGKYIDAPYTIKRKGLAIYINGIQVTKELEYPEKNPYEYNIRLGIPPCLNKNSTISDIWKCNEPLKGFGYTQAMCYYFFTHYEYYAAYDSIVSYFRSLPNIKTFELTDNGWVITTFNNEKQTIACFAFMMDQVNKKWGPHGTGPIPKKEFIRRVEKRVESIEYSFKYNNGLNIFFTDFDKFFPTHILLSGNTKRYLPYLYRIMHSNLTNEQKIDSLKLIYRGDEKIKTFVENYTVSPQFIQRIKNGGYDTLKTDLGKPKKKTGYKPDK